MTSSAREFAKKAHRLITDHPFADDTLEEWIEARDADIVREAAQDIGPCMLCNHSIASADLGFVDKCCMAAIQNHVAKLNSQIGIGPCPRRHSRMFWIATGAAEDTFTGSCRLCAEVDAAYERGKRYAAQAAESEIEYAFSNINDSPKVTIAMVRRAIAALKDHGAGGEK